MIISIFNKIKPKLSFSEQHIVNNKINQRKKDVNKLLSNFETEEIKINKLKTGRRTLINNRNSMFLNSNLNLIDKYSERKQIKKSLYDKIKFGSIEFFDHIKKNKNEKLKKISFKKDYFLNSKNFDFGRTSLVSNDNNYSTYRNNNINSIHNNNSNQSFYQTKNSFKKIRKRNQFYFPIKKFSSNEDLKKIINKTSSTFYLSPKKEINYNNENNINNNHNINLSDFTSRDFSNNKTENSNLTLTQNLSKNKIKLNNIKKTFTEEIKKNILSFDLKMKKNKIDLKRFISSSENKKRITEIDFLKKDMDEVLGKNLLENNEKRNNLKIGIKGKNGLINSIDLNKAKIIKLSDKIKNLTDEIAIDFIYKIQKEYKEESKNVGIGFLTLESGRKIDFKNYGIHDNKIMQLIKKQMERNSKKIKKLRFRIALDNTKLILKNVPLSE